MRRWRAALLRANGAAGQWLLHATRPRANWLLTALVLGVVAKLLSIPFGFLGSMLPGAGGGGGGLPPPRHVSYSTGRFVMAGLVLAPLVETLQIMLAHWLIRRRLGVMPFVLASAVLAYVLHDANNFPLGAAAVFTVMAAQYASFKDARGTATAYWGVCATHVTVNALTLGLIRLLF